MNPKAVADAYRQGSIENAPPIKIVRMLYQGALRLLSEAIASDPAGITFRDRVARTDQIVTELRLALIPEHNPELCENLESLYLFVEGCLIEAARDQSVDALVNAQGILETLGDAWAQVELDTGQ